MRSLSSGSRPGELRPDIVDLDGDRGGVGMLGDAVALEAGVGLDLDKAQRGVVLAVDAEPGEIAHHAQRHGMNAGNLVLLGVLSHVSLSPGRRLVTAWR